METARQLDSPTVEPCSKLEAELKSFLPSDRPCAATVRVNQPFEPHQQSEPQDTVLDIDAAPGDCLYRICRSNCASSRIVYVHVLSTDLIPEDDRTYGPAVVRQLSKLAEWQREWKTLTISANDDADSATSEATLRISMDDFEPHFMSPEPDSGAAQPQAKTHKFIKLARFKFEIKALEREVKAYHMLRGSALAPALVGYVYEETHDRVVGLVTEQVIGHWPRDAADYAACSVALDKLHESGLVHGDLNKYNIIITKDGPRFIDFEVSRLRNEVTNWNQLAQNEKHTLSASLSDQSGLGAPWQQ